MLNILVRKTRMKIGLGNDDCEVPRYLLAGLEIEARVRQANPSKEACSVWATLNSVLERSGYFSWCTLGEAKQLSELLLLKRV